MTLKKVLAGIVVLFASSDAIAATQTAMRLNQFNAWGSYFYGAGDNRICYVLSTPSIAAPINVNHGDIFFMVLQRPNQNDHYEPQVLMGYALKEDSVVTVAVDGKEYVLFTQGNFAWVRNEAKEPQLVAALRAGRSMHVDATSQRGTSTHYTFSLSGVTAALKSISRCQ